MKGLMIVGVLLVVAAFVAGGLIAAERPVTGERCDLPVEKPDYNVTTEVTQTSETVVDTVVTTMFMNCQ
jgi:hypothetical protein